jgi:hypothetical protein
VEPFRLKHGAVLHAALGVKVEPGFFSQQMACPWQADFFACHKAPEAWSKGQVFGWWPSQRPDDTFKDAAKAASGTYQEWDRGITGGTGSVLMKKFTTEWKTRGFVMKSGSVQVETEGPP